MVAVDLCLGAIKRFLRPCERLIAGLQQGSRPMIDPCLEPLVAFVGQLLAPVGDPFPLIGGPLPLVGGPLPLIGHQFAPVSDTVAFVGPTRSVLKLPERLLNAHCIGWTLRVSAFTGRGFHSRTHSRLR